MYMVDDCLKKICHRSWFVSEFMLCSELSREFNHRLVCTRNDYRSTINVKAFTYHVTIVKTKLYTNTLSAYRTYLMAD